MFLWAEAIYTAAYIRNRCPTKISSNTIPYELWHKRRPSVKYIRRFGCRAIVLNKKAKSKFLPKGNQMIFVGYAEQTKAYRIYDKSSKSFMIARDVIFYENEIDETESGSICIVITMISFI